MNKGLLIVFEGNDRSRKTIISKLAYEELGEVGYSIPYTRKPGDIDIAEQARSIMLSPTNMTISERCGALLYAASHRQHLIEKVLPAPRGGKIALCDRPADSSLVYQGIARGIGVEEVFATNQFVTEGHLLDATMFLSIDFETELSRITDRGSEDRLSNESMKFHKLVAQGYELIKDRSKERVHIVDADPNVDTVLSSIVTCPMEIIKNHV